MKTHGAVIAISENTKEDIIKFTDVDPDRVHVIYLGNPFEHLMQPSALINPSSDSPYLKNPTCYLSEADLLTRILIFLLNPLQEY